MRRGKDHSRDQQGRLSSDELPVSCMQRMRSRRRTHFLGPRRPNQPPRPELRRAGFDGRDRGARPPACGTSWEADGEGEPCPPVSGNFEAQPRRRTGRRALRSRFRSRVETRLGRFLVVVYQSGAALSARKLKDDEPRRRTPNITAEPLLNTKVELTTPPPMTAETRSGTLNPVSRPRGVGPARRGSPGAERASDDGTPV